MSDNSVKRFDLVTITKYGETYDDLVEKHEGSLMYYSDHDRIVAAKDAEIARLQGALETAKQLVERARTMQSVVEAMNVATAASYVLDTIDAALSPDTTKEDTHG